MRACSINIVPCTVPVLRLPQIGELGRLVDRLCGPTPPAFYLPAAGPLHDTEIRPFGKQTIEVATATAGEWGRLKSSARWDRL